MIVGVSVTATTANLWEIIGREFLDELRERGCKAVIYVEFVPVTEESKDLAPGDAEREYLKERLFAFCEEYPNMIFIPFPGDEKSSGGCLAAGRGFFHINSHVGAELCPFSPYSDINVKKHHSVRRCARHCLPLCANRVSSWQNTVADACCLSEKKAWRHFWRKA